MNLIFIVCKQNNPISIDLSGFEKIWRMLWLTRHSEGLTTWVICWCSHWCGWFKSSRFWCSRVMCCGYIGCVRGWRSGFDSLIRDTFNLNVRDDPLPTGITVPFRCIIWTGGKSLFSFSKNLLTLIGQENVPMKTVLGIARNLWSISANRNRPIQITVRM